MQGLVEKFKRDDEFEAIVDSYKRGLREQLASGLSNSARQVFYAALYQTMARPLVIVTHNMFQAQKIYDDMNQLLPSDEVWLYPANEMVLSEVSISSPETLSQRIEVLKCAGCGQKRSIGCSICRCSSNRHTCR